MIQNILILTRYDAVEEVSYVVKPYCMNLDIASIDLSNHVLETEYDLIISYCYAPIIKSQFINSCNCPIVNVHPTYLPYGRGIYPIMWASLYDHPFGVSLHLIDSEEIDSGAIIMREKIDLNDELTLREARNLLMLYSRILLKRFLMNYDPNNELSGVPQDELGKKQEYKSRKESITIYNKLPSGWDTCIKDVRSIKSLIIN